MNYKKIYYKIIQNRLLNPVDGYYEKHHIIPKSLGGSNNKENIVKLSAREHFICHYLLIKMYSKNSNEWYKMIKAFMLMKACSLNQKRYCNSRLYEYQRIHFSKVQSNCQQGKKNSQYNTMWIYNTNTLEIKKIKKDEKIPNGWERGRKITNEEIKMSLKDRKKSYNKRLKIKKIKREIKRFFILKRKIKKHKQDIKKWRPIFEDYLENNFEYVKNKYKLTMKHSAFITRIKKLFKQHKTK